MRILQVSQNHHIRGGSDRVYLDTCALLAARGHEPIPFAAQHPANLATPWSRYFPKAADFERPGFTDIVRYVYSGDAARALTALLAAHRPDRAHLHIYYGKLTASVIPVLRRAGIPIIQTMHEYRLVSPNYTLLLNGQLSERACGLSNAWRAIPQRFNRGSVARSALATFEWYVSRAIGSLHGVDHFLAISDFQRQLLIRHGVPPGRVTRIYNFVQPPSHTGHRGVGDYFLYYGRIELTKGVQVLMDAAEAMPESEFRIVGDGGAKESIQRDAAHRGLTNVRFMPFLSGMALDEAIRNSRATVLPSLWYEPFGLTVAESFVRRRAVIASRIGGIAELIDDGRDGLLVDPGSASSLVRGLRRLAREPALATDMGERGAEKASRMFHPDAHYQQLLAVYESVGARTGATARLGTYSRAS